jgi:hypothetical protein
MPVSVPATLRVLDRTGATVRTLLQGTFPQGPGCALKIAVGAEGAAIRPHELSRRLLGAPVLSQ